jgi:hypothetical protein
MNQHEDIIKELRESWGWVGLEPVEVVGESDFGNLIVRDQDGRYWRLAPEDCTCQIIAADRCELDALTVDQDFLHDWYMAALVDAAREKFGTLVEGRKYCLRIPGLLGGEYGGSNLASAPLVELVRTSGSIAQQVRDLPDGAVISLTLTD